MGGNHLFDLFAAAVPRPDKVALDLPGGDAVSYGALLGLSARLAGVLAARGLEPGDRVAVQVEKSWQALALYLACLRAGGAFLPLNTAYTGTEIDFFLGDAAPRLFVCDPVRAASAAKTAARHGVLHVETMDAAGAGSLADAARRMPARHDPVARGEKDLAAILYTSGTTGRSKGAMLSHGNLASNARALVEAWRFTPDDVLLHALPIFHIHGLFVAGNVALLSGASMIFLPKFDLDRVMAEVPRATVMMGVPTFYNRMITRGDLTPELCKGMRLFISGSAPLSAEVHKDFAARTGHAICERYGMTETGINTSNPYEGERRAGTVGLPLPGVTLRITEPASGRPLPDRDIGMIEVKGPNVFSGYWRMPEKTAAEFRDGYFITGDMGMVDARGYVSIVGREKDLIITGGLNVYPAEVESRIDEIPGVAECAVIGVPHPDMGEGVVAVVAARNGTSLCEGDILAPLGTVLARFKQPKRVIIVDALPRNTMGKIEKTKLRDDYRSLFQGQG
jgi:malonyl-CoA/methylmalonyl-CoA synthetase